jgi:hypothetical protein
MVKRSPRCCRGGAAAARAVGQPRDTVSSQARAGHPTARGRDSSRRKPIYGTGGVVIYRVIYRIVYRFLSRPCLRRCKHSPPEECIGNALPAIELDDLLPLGRRLPQENDLPPPGRNDCMQQLTPRSLPARICGSPAMKSTGPLKPHGLSQLPPRCSRAYSTKL